MTAFSLFEDVPIVIAAVIIGIAAWRGVKIIIVHRQENGEDR